MQAGPRFERVRGVPVGRAPAEKLPHVWVENVCSRKKSQVAEFHIVKAVHDSLDKQFDRSLPDIYRFKAKHHPKPNHTTLEYVSCDDRQQKIHYVNNDAFGNLFSDSLGTYNSNLCVLEPPLKRKKRGKHAKRKENQSTNMSPPWVAPVSPLEPPPPSLGQASHRIVNPPAPKVTPNASMGYLDTFDWLVGGARRSTTTTQDAKFYESLPKLKSKQRKKNRHARQTNKKKAAKLSADVVALQSAMLLIQDHGYGG